MAHKRIGRKITGFMCGADGCEPMLGDEMCVDDVPDPKPHDEVIDDAVSASLEELRDRERWRRKQK